MVNKGQKVEKEIFLALFGDDASGIGFLELCSKMEYDKKTVRKYLRIMELEGTVNSDEYKNGAKGRWWIDVDVKTRYKIFQDSVEKIARSRTKMTQIELQCLETSKKLDETHESRYELVNFLIQDYDSMFDFYTKLVWNYTISIFPALLIKEVKQEFERQLKEMETFLKHVKAEDPIVYRRFIDTAKKLLQYAYASNFK